MKKSYYSFVISAILITMISCESKGPKGRVDVPNRSQEEIVHDVLDGDGWSFRYDVELHYKQDGEWLSAGMYRVYSNHADDDHCDLWVDFDGFRSPAEKCSNYGYSYKVKYQGVCFYF